MKQSVNSHIFTTCVALRKACGWIQSAESTQYSLEGKRKQPKNISIKEQVHGVELVICQHKQHGIFCLITPNHA